MEGKRLLSIALEPIPFDLGDIVAAPRGAARDLVLIRGG